MTQTPNDLRDTLELADINDLRVGEKEQMTVRIDAGILDEYREHVDRERGSWRMGAGPLTEEIIVRWLLGHIDTSSDTQPFEEDVKEMKEMLAGVVAEQGIDPSEWDGILHASTSTSTSASADTESESESESESGSGVSTESTDVLSPSDVDRAVVPIAEQLSRPTGDDYRKFSDRPSHSGGSWSDLTVRQRGVAALLSSGGTFRMSDGENTLSFGPGDAEYEAVRLLAEMGVLQQTVDETWSDEQVVEGALDVIESAAEEFDWSVPSTSME